MNRQLYRQSVSFRESGVALPIALILLFVMTLIGIASLNISVFEEQMSASTRLREAAFNAAETTLRAGELEAGRLNENSAIRLGNIPGESFRLFVQSATENGWPEIGAGAVHPGDTCTSGYCIPAQFHLTQSTTPNGERWADPDLDVWNEPSRHRVLENFASSGLRTAGVEEAPKYIIEYLGSYPVTDGSEDAELPTDVRDCDLGSGPIARAIDWPFCISPAHLGFFRITARAEAGIGGRGAVVMLQSTIKVPID